MERIKPSEVRPKSDPEDVSGMFMFSEVCYALHRAAGFFANPKLKRDALTVRAKGLILQNPRPEDLKKVRRS